LEMAYRLNLRKMISNFFKTYLRTLWRNKIYSSINTIGLSIAMACAILIILYAHDEVSYDRFHENGKNIFRVVHKRVNPVLAHRRSIMVIPSGMNLEIALPVKPPGNDQQLSQNLSPHIVAE